MAEADSLRMDELESRLAFLDDTVDKLNDVIARQDQEIRIMQQRLSEMVTKLDDIGGAEGQGGVAQQHEIPPHY